MGLMSSCPGSKIFKNPVPEPIACSGCNEELEIWSDEIMVRCKKCGSVTFKSRMPSCIDWCKHADACVGPEIMKRLKAS